MKTVKATKSRREGKSFWKLSISAELLSAFPRDVLGYIGNSIVYKLHLERDSLIVFSEGDPLQERRMWVPEERLFDVRDRINWWIRNNDENSK